MVHILTHTLAGLEYGTRKLNIIPSKDFLILLLDGMMTEENGGWHCLKITPSMVCAMRQMGITLLEFSIGISSMTLAKVIFLRVVEL